jgi:hypothetical protein
MKWTTVSWPAICVRCSAQSLCSCRPGGVSKRTVARRTRKPASVEYSPAEWRAALCTPWPGAPERSRPRSRRLRPGADQCRPGMDPADCPAGSDAGPALRTGMHPHLCRNVTEIQPTLSQCLNHHEVLLSQHPSLLHRDER